MLQILAIIFVQTLAINESPKNIKELSKLLIGDEYKGKWTSNSQIQQFNYMTEDEGDAYMIFLPQSQSNNSEDNIIERMEIQLLNPTYVELRQSFAIFQLTNYSDDQISFENISSINYTNVYKYRRKYLSRDQCQIDYSVNINFEDEKYDKEHVQILVNLQTSNKEKDSNCDLDLSMYLTLDTTNYLLRIILYCVMSLGICLIQCYCVTKLCQQLLENDQDANKLSLITVGYLTVQDGYICIQNFYESFINYYFILPAFFYLLLATTCDMKLLYIVWRNKHLEELFDQQRMRRAITLFFAQFYFCLIIFFIFGYFFENYNWYMTLTGLSMVPQIIHNVRLGNNPKFIGYFVFGILFPSNLYSIYYRGCPDNIKGMEPSLAYCMIFLSSYIFQVSILYIQFKLGPRCIIPRCFLPKQYQYLKTIHIQEEEEDCAICLTSLSQDPGFLEDNQTDKLVLKQGMLTPCGHWFHPSCLRSWIDIKMQCPTCRATLPPMQQ